MDKYVCHFSCGAASAIASIITLIDKPNTELLYTDPMMEHPDNMRFLKDIERLLNIKITILKHDKYNSPFEIFEARRFLASPSGAPCTYLGERLVLENQVLGFDYSKREIARMDRYKKEYPEIKLICPLIDHKITKEDCFYILEKLNIKLPHIYSMGYSNANCTGCVKAENLGYWAAIREDFPDIYNKYAKLERAFGKTIIGPMSIRHRGVAINKRYIKCPYCKDKSCGMCNKHNQLRLRVYLDELPINTKPSRSARFSCNGLFCSDVQVGDMFDDAGIETRSNPKLKQIIEKITTYLINKKTTTY
jgi:hypothetical protein